MSDIRVERWRVLGHNVDLTYKIDGVEVHYSCQIPSTTDAFDAFRAIHAMVKEINAVKSEVEETSNVKQPEAKYTATCDSCGNLAMLRFKPKANKPIYCEDCYTRRNFKGETKILSRSY